MTATEMVSSGWTISLRPNAWLWLLLVCAVGVLAWYVYRRTVPPVEHRWRWALRALRLGALGMLALAVLGPRFVWQGMHTRAPRVTVLVDQSESLSFTDPEGRRADAVKRVLSGPGMSRIRSEATVSWQGFAHTVSRLDVDELSFTGDASAIGEALLEQRRTMPPPDVVILITDGANTTGPDPLRAAEEIKLPIYVIGVGDPNPQADVRVVGVSAPQLALAGRAMKVTATVENTGLSARPATVRILNRGRTLAQETITLPPSGRRSDVELTVTPPAPGIMRSIVALDSIPGEILTQNNLWPFTTQVLKSKRLVLVFGGAPSADIAFWIRFFRERDDLDVRLWLAPHPARQSHQPSGLLDSLAEADLIVWHDMPPGALPQERTNAIMRAVEDGAGLLVVPGKNALPQSWQPMLPVEVGRGHYADQRTQALWTPESARHPLVTADADFPNWSLAWGNLPPLLGRTVGLVQTPGSTMLLTGEGDVLAVAGTYRKGRVLAFGGLTYWRWDMIPHGLGEPAPVGDSFWNAAVRWLSTRQELSRVRVQTDSPLYRLGEPVRCAVQVYDEQYAPLDGADVRLDIDDGALAITAASQGEGRYVAEVSGLGPGEHRATATAVQNGTTLGTSTAEFSVAVVGLEHEQTRQQQDVLEAVARAGRGAYAPAWKADSLLSAVPLTRIAEQHERTIALGSSGWVLWTIIGLLTVEWIGRRVLGLL